MRFEIRRTFAPGPELARRMTKPREQIDRLFRLDHASQTDQIEAAFRAFDLDVDVRLRERERLRD